MGWIEDIISDENKKFRKLPWCEEKYNCNWAKLAEDRIIKQLAKDGALKKEFLSE